MLVISRKEHEAVHLSGGITVRVLEMRGDRVSLGIDAPASVKVQRLPSDQDRKASDKPLDFKREKTDTNAH